MLNERGTGLRAMVVGGVLATLALSACGGEESFENERRPPAPIAITGVITPKQVTISPNEFGAGPIVLTISNQTPQSHRVVLEGRDGSGSDISETTAPINPQDAATIQQSLPPGQYEVSANSEGSSTGGIQPGRIDVGDERPSASDELELP